jgi:hypothetical protein
MSRNPFSLEPIDKSLLYKGVFLNWFFIVIFFSLIGVAIKEASTFSLVLVIGSLIVLILIITGFDDEDEIIIMYKKIKWYKNYTRLTFLSGIIFAITWPFESTFFVTLIIGVPALINGTLVWPQLTVNTYAKNYTKLFGRLDA